MNVDLSAVHPELREAVRTTPRLNVHTNVGRRVARFRSRYLDRVAAPPDVTVTNVRSRDARLRLYVPRQQSGAGMLVIHGGGMVVGAPQAADAFCYLLSTRLRLTIASADYRLAPAHPYPAPQDDCLDAWNWFQRNARRLGVDPRRIVVGGGSAGGGLAASVANSVHDRGGQQPVAQWLLYPMLDDRTAVRTELDALDHFVWNNAANRVGWTALLRGTAAPGADDVPPAAAPARRADLYGLPPTWLAVGSIDLFHAEDVDYAERLRAAGVPVQLEVVEGAPHAFDGIAPNAPMVHEFVESALDWLNVATR